MLDQALDTGFKVKLDGTPLADHDYVDLVETVIELDSARPDMAVLRFRDTRWSAGSPTTDLISAIGFALQKTLVLTEARTDNVVFTGEIASLEFDYTKAGRHAVIRAYDRSHRLHRGRRTRVFKDSTDSDIFKQVISGWGIAPGDVTSTTVQHVHLPQLNQTDWEFLRWRAEENGFTMETDDKGALCFHEPKNTKVAALDAQADLFAFRPKLTAPYFNEVDVTAWDATQTQVLTSTESIKSTPSATLSSSPDSLVGKFSGQKSASVIRPGLQQAEIDVAAKTLAERYSQTFAEAEAVAQGNAKLRPGCVVEIKGVPATFNGKYRITAARHVLNQHGYRTHMVFSGENDRSALALSSDGLASTPKLPRMHGLVTGIVTVTASSGSSPAPPDPQHVKVKFDWLKDKNGQPYETDWVKTVQLGAGNGFGLLILPEVNDEVLVGFEHGDLRRPYVIGGVYNAQKNADTKLNGSVVDGSGAIVRRGFTSRKKHRLAFEDGDSTNNITLVTGDDNFTIVLDQQNTKITIDSKNGKVEIHGSQDISIKNDSGDISIEAAAGKLSLKGQSGVDVQSQSGDVSVSGINANVKGNAKVSVSAPAAEVKADAKLDLNGSAMVQIQGGLVKIN